MFATSLVLISLLDPSTAGQGVPNSPADFYLKNNPYMEWGISNAIKAPPVLVAESHGAVTSYQAQLGEPPISIYRTPESKSKPSDQLRVLVLGTGANWREVEKASTNPKLVAADGQPFDIIIGPCCDFGEDQLTNIMADLASRVAIQDISKTAAFIQANTLEEVLRKELGIPKGPIKISELDMHSNGTTVATPLLAGVLAPNNIRAIEPALGRDGWALQDLIDYSKRLIASGSGGKVQVSADNSDIVPAASGATWLGLVPDLLKFKFGDYKKELLQRRQDLQSDGFEFLVLDQKLPGLVAEHYLENAIAAINAKQFVVSPLEQLNQIWAQAKLDDAVPLKDVIAYANRPSSPLPFYPKELAAEPGKQTQESEYFFRLQMRERLPKADEPARQRIALVTQANNGSYGIEAGRFQPVQFRYLKDRELGADTFRRLSSGFGNQGQSRTCPVCTGSGRPKMQQGIPPALKSQLEAQLRQADSAVAEAARQGINTSAYRAAAARLRQLLAGTGAPQAAATCTLCRGTGRL